MTMPVWLRAILFVVERVAKYLLGRKAAVDHAVQEAQRTREEAAAGVAGASDDDLDDMLRPQRDRKR